MLNKIIAFSILLLTGCPLSLDAQPYERVKTRAKQVKEIIEWQDQGKGKQASKIGHSFFDRQGRLVAYHSGQGTSARQTQQYDKQGRIVEIRLRDDDRLQATFYAYPEGQKVRHTTYRKKHYKTYWYYKKGQLVEMKSFAKGEELGDVFELKERRLYLYDNRDSLRSEVHYIHPIAGTGSPMKRKVLHRYDSRTGKRQQTRSYASDGKIRSLTQYRYDSAGRLQQLTESFSDGRPTRSLTCKYQKGQLWQRIDDYGYERSVQIFKEGRLIRTRCYVGDSLFSLVDYQYLYY